VHQNGRAGWAGGVALGRGASHSYTAHHTAPQVIRPPTMAEEAIVAEPITYQGKSVKDVPAADFITAFSAYLKSTGKVRI
jgi:hypothetical protein